MQHEIQLLWNTVKLGVEWILESRLADYTSKDMEISFVAMVVFHSLRTKIQLLKTFQPSPYKMTEYSLRNINGNKSYKNCSKPLWHFLREPYLPYANPIP
jgi:hypothetical protein